MTAKEKRAKSQRVEPSFFFAFFLLHFFATSSRWCDSCCVWNDNSSRNSWQNYDDSSHLIIIIARSFHIFIVLITRYNNSSSWRMLLALANCGRRHHSVIFPLHLLSPWVYCVWLLRPITGLSWELASAATTASVTRDPPEMCVPRVWASKCNKQYMKRIVNNRRLSERNNETPTDWLTHMLKCSSRACYYFAVLMSWIRWAAHTQHGADIATPLTLTIKINLRWAHRSAYLRHFGPNTSSSTHYSKWLDWFDTIIMCRLSYAFTGGSF